MPVLTALSQLVVHRSRWGTRSAIGWIDDRDGLGVRQVGVRHEPQHDRDMECEYFLALMIEMNLFVLG